MKSFLKTHFCQSGEISPNLTTLFPLDRFWCDVISHNVISQNFRAAIQCDQIWQNFKSSWKCLVWSWFGICANFGPALAILSYWANFLWYKRPKIEKWYVHLVTLLPSDLWILFLVLLEYVPLSLIKYGRRLTYFISKNVRLWTMLTKEIGVCQSRVRIPSIPSKL